MRRKNTRLIYTMFAIFCMLIFYIGSFLVIRNEEMQYYSSSDDDTIEVFQSKEEKNKSLVLFNILGKTNSHIKLFIRNGVKNYSGYLDFLKENFNIWARLKSLIRSQFPTILSSASIDFEDSFVSDTEEEKPEVLEDLILIDEVTEEDLPDIDEEGGYEGKIPKAEGIVPLEVDKDNPYVLIYHTHGTEAYLPIKDNTYHTTDKTYNVLTVGEIIKEVLTKRDHKVRHVETYHDHPSYTGSYSRSLTTANAKLKEEPNLKVIFDVHRDGVPDDANKNKALDKTKTNIDGKDVATFSMVVGPGTPNKDAVLNFAKYIKKVSDTMYPGLCSGIIMKPTGKFNQFLSDYYALIEVGSNLNTVDEAKETAVLLGEIISVVIDNIQK